MSGIEILGIAASVIQIADAGARLSSKLFVFTRKVKNADQSISNISGEIAATGAALRQLGEALEDDKFASLRSKQSIDTTNQIVADCWKVFNDINDTIGGGQLVRQKGQHDAKDTVALAQIKQPSFGFKQRLRFPYVETQINLLKTKLEGLKSSLMLMLQVLLLAEQVRNGPRLAVSEEQKALLQTLIDERNAKEAEFDSSCMAIEKAPIAPSDLESFNTGGSTSADTPVTDEQEMKAASTPRAIPALCEPGNASNVVLAQSVPEPCLKQPFTRTATTKPIAETSAPSSPSVITLTPVSSINEADSSSFSDKTLPRSLQMRQREIEHHAQLVQNLLDEIGHIQYQIDYGIRHRMHDGVLKLHWDEWSPHASKHGHEHFHKSFEKHEYIARYWVDQYEDGVRVSSSTPAGSNDIAKEHVHFTDAVGRKYNIPLEQCQSWDSMNELIIREFAHIEALTKPVSQGRFDLQADDGSIILPQFWNSVVKPGIEVNMLLWALQEPAPILEALPMAQGQDAILKLDDLLRSPKKKNKTTEKSTNKTKTLKKPDKMLDHKRSTPVLNAGTQAGTDSVLDVKKTTNSPELQVDAIISMPDPEVLLDEEQIRVCHELFSDFDFGNKGRISKDILKGALEAFLAILGYSGTLEVDTEALLDVEKDLGGLSSEGIDMNLFIRCAARSSQIQKAYEDSTVLLRIFDTNNEEVNDCDELKEVIRSLGGAISDEEYDVFLHEHAQSGTRQLGYADCLSLLRDTKLLTESEVETVTQSIAEDSDQQKPLAVVKLHRRTYQQHLKAVQEHEQWRNLARPLIGIEDHDPEAYRLEDALEAGTIRNGEIIAHVGADWPRWAFAMWDYTGTTEADLSFRRGDNIEILSEGDGNWLVGRLSANLRKTGCVPSNHVSYMPVGFVPKPVTPASRHSRVVASEEVDETQTETQNRMSVWNCQASDPEGLDTVIENDKEEATGEEINTMRVPNNSATPPNTSYVREYRESPLYVNEKQLHGILKRRAAREKLGDEPNDREYRADSGSSNTPDSFHSAAESGLIGDLIVPALGTDRDALTGHLEGGKDYISPSKAQLARAAKRFSKAWEDEDRLSIKCARIARSVEDEYSSEKEDLVDDIDMLDDETETRVYEEFAMEQHRMMRLIDLLSEFTTLNMNEILVAID